MKATWNDQLIAESNETIVIEGNQYFPLASVTREFLTKSDYTTECHWKGTAHYHSLIVDGKTNSDAAWYYPEPKDAAREITDRIAFWKGVEVS